LQVIERPSSITSDLKLEAVAVTEAPPKPRFETSKELQHETAVNGARPRIVVPIDHKQMIANAPVYAPVQQPGRVTVAVPGARQVPASGVPAVKSTRGWRAILVAVILVVVFAGMLLATRNYIRTRWAQTTTQENTVIGQEAVTTTDLNLRAGPSSANDQVGLAESGSRVKVLNLNSNANWCEVQVLQHSRPKYDPSSLDRGWVNKRFLKFD
jgi:hypothetical protein